MSTDSSNPSCRCSEPAVRYYITHLTSLVVAYNYMHMRKFSVMKY